MGEKIVDLRKIKDLKFVKKKRRNLEILDFFDTFKNILGTFFDTF